MARKKQEVALQLEINSQEEWEELMQKEGLIVVDVFQDWCGPCKAVLSFFRRIKNEIGDDFLHFATAKCDTIDSLDKYRGRCEPCFLIYGGGALVSVVRGANPPALEEVIKLKLGEEHKVMKGEIERKEIKDPYLSGVDVEEKEEKDDKDVEEIEQEVTLALIKPDVVKAGKVDEIIAKLKERGIEILAQQERNLSEAEARSFYHHMENSEYFENLITFLASGPSYILVLAKGDEGIIHEFRELIGPKVFEEAKEKAPESFRAMYGSNSIENAIHGADDKESAHRELAFFFPDFVAPKISRKKQEDSHLQRTLALIRPAAFAEFKDSILEKIKLSGFKIAMQKEVKLNKEDAELFYKDHAGKPFFEELTMEMSKGTLLALALEKQHAVSGFRGILGPKDVEKAKENDPSSLRAQFSLEEIGINLIHGSDSEESAQNELKYFFPVEQTIAAIKPDGAENREEIINRIVEARFRIVKSSDIVMTKEMAEDFYADQRDEEYFDDLVAHMQSGPTLFMVLSREDAIRGWRSIMGPKDPNIAAEAYPDSIRGIYGKDVKENAVYGSADSSEMSRVTNLIFGKLEFNEDGTLLPQYETTKTEDDDKVMDTTDSIDNHNQQSIKENISIIENADNEPREPEIANQIRNEEDQDTTISETVKIDQTITEHHVSDIDASQHSELHHSEGLTAQPSGSDENIIIPSVHSKNDVSEGDTVKMTESEPQPGIDSERPKDTEQGDLDTGVSEVTKGPEEVTDDKPYIEQDETIAQDDSLYLESLGGPAAAGMSMDHGPSTVDKVEESMSEDISDITHDKTKSTNENGEDNENITENGIRNENEIGDEHKTHHEIDEMNSEIDSHKGQKMSSDHLSESEVEVSGSNENTEDGINVQDNSVIVENSIETDASKSEEKAEKGEEDYGTDGDRDIGKLGKIDEHMIESDVSYSERKDEKTIEEKNISGTNTNAGHSIGSSIDTTGGNRKHEHEKDAEKSAENDGKEKHENNIIESDVSHSETKGEKTIEKKNISDDNTNAGHSMGASIDTTGGNRKHEHEKGAEKSAEKNGKDKNGNNTIEKEFERSEDADKSEKETNQNDDATDRNVTVDSGDNVEEETGQQDDTENVDAVAEVDS